MIIIKRNYIVFIIVLIFIFPSIASAIIVEGKTQSPSYKIVQPAEKQDIQLAKSENGDEDSGREGGFFNLKADNDASQQTQTQASEEKQEIMEKALELLELADKYWERGDIDKTLNTLDEAYALILDANGDPTVAQEKDDVRLLISRRILAVYSSKNAVVNGKNSEVPLLMSADVEKEIKSFQTLERDNFIAAYQRSGMYRSTIIKELKKAGIPEELFWLPLVESLFKINAYSRARALGLWQFIPSTGYKFGLTRDEWVDERMDVQKSTKAAIAYLKELHNMFGDWLTALAAYNCGEGRVLRVISRQHINYLDGFWDLYRQLPNETARYVPRFLATLHIVKNPQKYGFDLSNVEKPVDFETVKANKIMKFKDIAEKIEISEDVLALLNPELTHKMTPDREYNLKIPEKSLDKYNQVCNDIPESEKPKFVAARGGYIKYRVKKGETVYTIAKKYGVSAASIRSCNRLGTKTTSLAQGRKIKIPVSVREHYASTKSGKKSSHTQTASAERYKVKKGDTLMMISRRFSVSVDQLKEVNNLKSGQINVGQNLKIPSKKAEEDVEESDVKKSSTKKSAQKSKINKPVLSAVDLDKLGPDKYIVTKNDSLNSIARKNNINLAKLLELNNLSSKEKIVPGQILNIR